MVLGVQILKFFRVFHLLGVKQIFANFELLSLFIIKSSYLINANSQ